MTFAIAMGSRNLPAELHELIVAITGPAGAEPQIEVEENDDLAVNQRTGGMISRNASAGTLGKGRSQPPQNSVTAIADTVNHVGVFRQEKQGEAESAVFGVESRHQFRFRFGQIERRAVRFGHAADKEKDETHRLQKTYQSCEFFCASTMLTRLKDPDSIRTPMIENPRATS